MIAPILFENTLTTSRLNYQQPNPPRIVPAQLEDCNAVVALFGALHTYNASLDSHFALSDGWETVLREQFRSSYNDPNMMWLLVKDGNKAVGLLIAGVHTDSPLFRHRQWVEVQALYVADSHRRMGIAHNLLNRAYADEGFATSQAIMRKKLG
jgi:GNAT superfamily N-acetyltransferase